MRDLVRARLAAVRSLRQARQQLSGFLLRHGCGFRGEWALISRDRGHAFRAILGSHFTGSWAGWPTLSWSQA
jgi:hypothetical protein